ncbi:PREDICTED: rab3 GTPase-activating protein non-catalytic subunit-like [Acropora digitifera]|uniref:rab3 GTPase-activating protein non-catalytic subunit-like n=1 Tax=Acropora digitifera TaxID=70779 RepID=UPI00077A319E|nr:PREDICTED: rab3 GTPase-activating protein non-catalytic subunit-like [Acropora digitifera]
MAGLKDTLETESEQLEISHSWLQECCISLSPSNDTLAVAKDDKAVFLASKWNKPSGKEPNIKYEISSQGSPDWTCIVVGFTSGYIRIYLQNGSMLLSQFLHDDPVLKLKCRTWQPHKNYGSAEQVEELAILYPRAMVIIDGFSLYQSLRACRNQLARAKASGSSELIGPPPLAYKKWRFDGQKYITDIASCGVVPPNMFDRLQRASFLGGFNASVSGNMPAMSHYVATGMEPFVAVYMAVEGMTVNDSKASGSSELIGPPPLAYKKWRFDGQKYITDIASCGVVPPNMFDRLQRASFLGGFNASVSGNMPAMSHYVATGMEPFVAVYMAVEGSSPALISDVALAVASKLTSAVLSRITAASGWLGWGTSSETQAKEPGKALKPKVEKGTILPARFGLPDTRRHGNSITLAPNGRLAVTTDDFGRVMLLDAKQAVVVRIWKGIWRTEQGPRVAAFNVGKDCRLLYAGHGIMGLGHVIKQGQAPPQHTLNCTLIQGDGTLKTFSVPFHCALSDKHSKRVRDLHLLKNLTSILDETKLTPENGKGDTEREEMEKVLLNILSDIQTPQLHHQGLQCVLSTVGIPSSVLLEAVTTVTEATKKKSESSVKKILMNWPFL